MQAMLHKQYLKPLIVIIFSLLMTRGFSQAPQFTIGSVANVNTTPITVPVTVKSFTQILAAQGSLNWDSTKLKFSSVNNVHAQLSGIQFSNPLVGTNQGKLGFIWVDAGVTPQTIADNSVLFNVVFNVPTTISGAVDIVFGDLPTSRLISDASLNPVTSVTYTKGTATIPFPLPLVLTQFTGSSTSTGNLLNWSTAQETNTAYFEVEKGTGGSYYSYVGKVTAAGYSNSTKTYSFIDASASASTAYYRLKQVDKDGSFAYSNTITIAPSVATSGLGIYPNPVQETLFAQVVVDKTETVTVQVTDFQGKVLRQQSLQLVKGSNNFSVLASALPKGNYLLIVKGSKKLSKQFVKE